MTYDLTDLQLFLRVVDQGSITQGAARAHLSLASASARIKAMEHALGTPLLTRHRRGVTPSPAGWLLVAHARSVVTQWTRMHSELARLSDGFHTALSLLANTSATESLLPAALADFLAESPDVDVELEERASHEIVTTLRDGRAELGIIADTVDTGGLECAVLRPDPLVVLVAAGHELAGRASTTFGDCLAHPFVGFVAGNPLQEHLSGQAQPLGLRPRYRARLCGTEAICRAVAAGVGIAVLPALAASRWRQELGLVTVDLTNTWARRSLLLCCPGWSRLSPPAAKLARHLTAYAAPDTP